MIMAMIPNGSGHAMPSTSNATQCTRTLFLDLVDVSNKKKIVKRYITNGDLSGSSKNELKTAFLTIDASQGWVPNDHNGTWTGLKTPYDIDLSTADNSRVGERTFIALRMSDPDASFINDKDIALMAGDDEPLPTTPNSIFVVYDSNAYAYGGAVDFNFATFKTFATAAPGRQYAGFNIGIILIDGPLRTPTMIDPKVKNDGSAT